MILDSKERLSHKFSYLIKTAEGTRDSHKHIKGHVILIEDVFLRTFCYGTWCGIIFVADLESSLGFYLFG